LTVTYTPEEAAATKKKSFDQAAFWDASAGKKATLATATWYKTWIESNYSGGEIYGLVISAAPETIDLEVANNGEGKYYYATLYEDAPYKIAAEQNGAKVMVYSAYVDETKNGGSWSNQVYMEQLTLFGGCYWIPSYTPVIVKSTSEDIVVAELTPAATANSMHSDASGWSQNNKIQNLDWYFGGEDVYGIELKEKVASFYGSGWVPYILAPIDEYGMMWSKFSDTRTIKAGTFFIVANNAYTEYASVIWTDGSEEATAIQNVKKANAENGAQYNLAGQKVNAAYKGIIIKDGKKMIQK
jgi:hypothetical protein